MNQQLQNLITLRDRVFPVVFEMEKEGRVNLDSYSCGTSHCLKGWYAALSGQIHQEVSLWCVRDFAKVLSGGENHFGLSRNENCTLFGLSFRGSLQDRYDFLCQLIDERMKLEVPERDFAKEQVE